jgi:2-hydroxychromene-2-carboxylate isomerase
MAEPIDFYFDFSSPYGYLASTEIDALAARHGRSVTWRPFVLGAAFKLTGQRALTEQPLRGDYARRDFRARRVFWAFRFKMPSHSLLRLGGEPRLLLGRGAGAGQGPGEGVYHAPSARDGI